jgi:uncharacterized paraquat-inducible protein A
MIKPSLIIKIKNFLKSLFWHMYAGFPKSSQQLINSRYDICKSCDYFDENNEQCLLCGCNINTKKQFMNKLAWKDQKCPHGKW